MVLLAIILLAIRPSLLTHDNQFLPLFSALWRTHFGRIKPHPASPWVQATKGMKSLALMIFPFSQHLKLILMGTPLPSWFFYCGHQKRQKIFTHSGYRRCSEGFTDLQEQLSLSSRVRRGTLAYEFRCSPCMAFLASSVEGHNLRSPLKSPLGEMKTELTTECLLS